MMGYKTPNIDRIAKEGSIFTDYYGEQSCTAGRSSFITGQSVFRTGLSKVGLPGSDLGLKEADPTIAVMLEDLGYATGQFGKNHLGDRDEHLPTNHGFDEFLGNLYHLNAEEEPEHEDYPGDMVVASGKTFREQFGPRGIFGQDEYSDGMVEHDMHIGQFLAKLDELGIADNTIVFYSTDNGPHYNTWPDAASTPFRGEKNTNWEGGWRVPAAVRWPGVTQPGSVSNGIVHHMDWLPTFAAAAGNPDAKKDLLKGYRSSALNRRYKVHLDGYDVTEHLRDPDKVKSPRKEVF
jgi:arylsulfatase